jgi:Pvc16 N-terminal domain
MNLAIQVPLNTMLADLDESLRRLLSGELERHGFESVAVVFDAPTREWAAAASGPTVNLFLYDLREATDLRETEWREHRSNGTARMARPPLRFECSYAVTAWARAIEDEHRLLSQVLAVLVAHQRLPADCLAGDLAEPAAQPYPLRTRIAAAREDGKADFWNAIGGSYKASFDYLVTLSCDPGVVVQRGPDVLTRQLTARRLGADRNVLEETQRVDGILVDAAAGVPIPDAWLALPETGRWAHTADDGRFSFVSVPVGAHKCKVRAADGSEGETELQMPRDSRELRVSMRSADRGR